MATPSSSFADLVCPLQFGRQFSGQRVGSLGFGAAFGGGQGGQNAGGAVGFLQNAQLLPGSDRPPFRPLGHLRIGGGR
ncbi:hypothetical protein CKO40_20595 [Halochromatium glycolicum]|uniref:Uncharacterized protein n=1 Tax=Halochromatium glycolicum TaxID=85075 RepID=A0AAJ0U8T8_9GAMM|nr:hypothetical protein [Halochromatium glycolicum]